MSFTLFLLFSNWAHPPLSVTQFVWNSFSCLYAKFRWLISHVQPGFQPHRLADSRGDTTVPMRQYMTILWCRHTWQFYGVDIHDNFMVSAYMTILWCRHTWQFYGVDIHDNFMVSTYMTILWCRHTWQFYGVDIHDNFMVSTYMTILWCRHTWQFYGVDSTWQCYGVVSTLRHGVQTTINCLIQINQVC